MEFSRIEKSLESHQVQKVDGRENRKKGKSDEEFRRQLREEREEKEREKEDKVEISEEEPAGASEGEAKTYRTAPRYSASDAATSLALLGLHLFTAKDSAESDDEDVADDAGDDTAAADDDSEEPDTAA